MGASGARFLTGGVFQCDISHRRSVAVLCMLYKIIQMKFNANKTKTMIVSRSRTIHSQSPTLTIDGTVLEESDDLVIL